VVVFSNKVNNEVERSWKEAIYGTVQKFARGRRKTKEKLCIGGVVKNIQTGHPHITCRSVIT
jgi:hypothetical protein